MREGMRQFGVDARTTGLAANIVGGVGAFILAKLASAYVCAVVLDPLPAFLFDTEFVLLLRALYVIWVAFIAILTFRARLPVDCAVSFVVMALSLQGVWSLVVYHTLAEILGCHLGAVLTGSE